MSTSSSFSGVGTNLVITNTDSNNIVSSYTMGSNGVSHIVNGVNLLSL